MHSKRGNIICSLPAPLLAFLAVIVLCGSAHAAQEPGEQTAPPVPPQSPFAKEMPATPAAAEEMFVSYDGQNVSSVRLAGQPDLDPSQFTSLMAQKPGEPFSLKAVNQTAEALRTTGKFKQVAVEVEPETGGVRVTYVLEPAVWYGIYEFPGAERFSYSQLILASNYSTQRPYEAEEVEKDRLSLKSFLQQQGYFEAQVQTYVRVDAAHYVADIVFQIDLSRKASFGNAVVQGGTSDQNGDLEHRLTTRRARLRGYAIRPGKSFNRSTLPRATRFLMSRLQSQGYLSARVKLHDAEYNPTTNRAEIHFQIDPGAKTNVNITGARVWRWTRRDLLPMYQGIGVDDETVEEGRQALVSHFQSKGFFNVKVDAQLKTDAGGDTVSYTINRGKKHKVTAVNIAGNDTLPNSRLTPSLTVKRKRFFSPGKFSDDLVRSSIRNLTAIYNAEGFSDAKVTSSAATDQGNVDITFHVVEGPRDIVNAIWVEGANTFPQSEFAPKGLILRPGEPYSQAHVQRDRATILANYLRAGYLNATFRETAQRLSKAESHRINVVYNIDEGPRVFTGDVLTLGRSHTSPRLIDKETVAIKPEKPLAESDLLITGSRLYDLTGVFDWAEVDPKRLITTQTREDVLVKVHEASRNEFQYGIGFEVIERGGSVPSGTVALPNLPPIGLPSNFSTAEATFYGPRGTAQYTRNNLRGKGESFSVTAFAGRLDQKGGLYYINPNFRWSAWKATTSGTIERNEENPIFSSQVLTAAEQFQRTVDHAQKNTVYFNYAYSKTDLTHVLIADLVPPQDQHIKLSTLTAAFTRDTRDNIMDAHRGVFDSLELDFNTSYLGSNVDFTKLTGQAAFYKQKFHGIVWANSVRIGLAQPFNGSFVPLSQAFFTGGGNSLRGIPLDSAGPQRAIFICPDGTPDCGDRYPFPTGGNELLIINTEARVPLSRIMSGLGFAAFYDGGGVFPYVGFHDFAPSYSNNIGGGLRYSTPIGPIRFDLGYNLNPIPNTSPPQYFGLQYFISIGQAF